MTLVSGGIRSLRIFVEVPWGGASNDSGVVDNGSVYAGYIFGYFRDEERYYMAIHSPLSDFERSQNA